MDLVELTIRDLACSPNTFFMPRSSATSPRGGGAVGIDVTHLLGRDAGILLMAFFMARAPPSPSEGGAVM